MPPLPVVLVGCGAVSQLFYAPALRALEGAGRIRVVALVDPAESARRQLQRLFPQARAAADLAAAVAPSGSLAIIATPPRWHADQTLAAFAGGWHVLCEKPMAAGSGDAARMIAAADATGRLLAVGLYKRFFPSSRYLRFLCGPDHPLGALLRFTIAEGGAFTWPAATPAFFQRAATPGGVLLDLGVHALDLLLWWLGEPTDLSYADDAMGGLEANARVTLRFGAATGEVRLSRDWATAQRYEFVFEHGAAAWTVNAANRLSLTLNGTPGSLEGTLQEPDGTLGATNARAFIAQLENVVAAVQDGTPLLVDGREGARSLRLIETCYERRRLLAQPWLTRPELPNARRWAATA